MLGSLYIGVSQIGYSVINFVNSFSVMADKLESDK